MTTSSYRRVYIVKKRKPDKIRTRKLKQKAGRVTGKSVLRRVRIAGG